MNAYTRADCKSVPIESEQLRRIPRQLDRVVESPQQADRSI